MCGFVAVWFDDAELVPNPVDVTRSRDLLWHRGPDMAGLLVGNGFGLGFRRLAILDLTGAANQPMSDPSGQFHLLFNGEIYNFAALRTELESLGHSFATNSDTEVVLHAWMQWGQASVDRLRGMFAFLVVDEKQGELWLARDHVGIKPLYYSRLPAGGPGGWIFASEAKAFAGWPGMQLAFDESTLPELLAYRYVTGERSTMRGVKRVLPGHVGLLSRALPDGSAIRWSKWFDARDAWRPAEPLTLDAAADRLWDALGPVVASELMSDVPLGSQLSGGIDSGVLTLLAARKMSLPIHAFTVYMDSPTVPDERTEARQRATLAGALLHEVALGEQEFSGRLAELSWHHDEPIDHPNSVALFALCREAKPSVTVLVSGQGADELLGGYERHPSALRQLWVSRRVPNVLRDLSKLLPTGLTHGRGEMLERAIRLDGDELLLASSAVVPPFLLGTLGIDGDAIGDFRRQSLRRSPGSALERLLFYDLETYLASILHRDDRMSMAASIESRVPYLQRGFMEAAIGLPPDCKLPTRSGRPVGAGKLAMRRIAQRLWEEPLRKRSPKVGFAVPVEHWLSEPTLHGRLQDIWAGRALASQYLPSQLRQFAQKGVAQNVRVATQLAWIALSLDMHLEALRRPPVPTA